MSEGQRRVVRNPQAGAGVLFWGGGLKPSRASLEEEELRVVLEEGGFDSATGRGLEWNRLFMKETEPSKYCS